MITNDNEFLGYLISKSNENNECDPTECQNDCELDLETFLYYMRRMNASGYIFQPNNEVIIITDLGKSHYVSQKDEIILNVKKSAKLSLKRIISIIVEIGIGIAIAYIIFKLGF